MITLHVHVEFIETILGTGSSDPEIHERFIASKAPDAPSRREEVAAVGVEEIVERGTTVFPKLDDGTPFLWNYMLKGFFKDACGSMRRATGSKSKNLRAYKQEIDRCIFCNPRRVVLEVPEGGEMTINQRPLRAETAQGPRVALAASEELPVGTTCDFDVVLLNHDLQPYVIEWLSYGQLRGIGQWRNGDHGRFHCRVTDEGGKVVFDNI